MKRFFKPLLIFCFLAGGYSAKAQLDLGLLLEAGSADANTYLQNYMAPAFIGLGFGMNVELYHTAKPHKTLGYDLTGSLIDSKVPPE